MRWQKTIQMVEAHAEGEVGRVITGGVNDIPGKAMLAKMQFMNASDGSLRRFCVFEPRGAAQMSTNILLPPGRLDRSPCGTGNSARLAVRHARGEVSVGQTDIARSIIDSAFSITLQREVVVGDRPAVIPTVSGQGWIHGLHQIGVDPSDPYPNGYMLSDCWGDAFDLVN